MSKRIESIADLSPDRTNANKGTQRGRGMVEASLRETGAGRSILADKDGRIIAGNKTLEAWVDIGGEIEVVRTHGDKLVVVQREDLDLSDDTGTARKLAYYDNRAGEVGLEWDAEQLLADIGAGVDLSDLFRQDELDEILADVLPKPEPTGDAEAQVDKAEELRQKWQVETGQLWQLGDHRLICGDCTDADVVARVMGGEKAQLCFTSPPYAEQRKQQYGGTPEAEYWDWFDQVQTGIRQSLSASGNFVLNIKPHAKELQRSLYVFDLVCAMVRQRQWLLVDEFCWLRTGIPQQVVHRFKNAFEPCYWFAASGGYEWYPESVMHDSDSVPVALGPGAGDTNAAKRQGKGGGAIQGNRIVEGKAYPSNVLNFKQNAEALGHPAAFPIQLPSFFVKCMASDGDAIYEPFSGSGTTIIACEQLGRKCRAVEISPACVAVALQRWADATGKTPVMVQ